MGDSEGKAPLAVNYGKTVGQVYGDAVECAVRQTMDLSILALVKHGQRHELDSGFPSFLPRWDLPGWIGPIFSKGGVALAGRSLKFSTSIFDLADTLALSGITFDQVTVVSHDLTIHLQPDGVTGPLSIFDGDDEQQDKLTALLQELTALICEDRAITNSISVSDSYKLSAIAVAAAFTEDITFGAAFEEKAEENNNSRDTSWEYIAAIVGDRRRFFRTTRGYVGQGPGCMQSGDLMAVLDDANAPLVLRPLAGDKEEHAFMGECYVYDIMSGEIVQMLGQDGFREKEFVLR
ncbi:hypothetical protein EK21DRAFT_84876 [Setomelanomma holmii]|uniref:Uncharacterized protein n=1 Tax=Setomelanomma holmii TaxID=210430 RepID=A0A9P4HIM6_9PLEO|nr:hypothetical protein EK21DRAFT_84876 [Setomelanomma holmii]